MHLIKFCCNKSLIIPFQRHNHKQVEKRESDFEMDDVVELNSWFHCFVGFRFSVDCRYPEEGQNFPRILGHVACNRGSELWFR